MNKLQSFYKKFKRSLQFGVLNDILDIISLILIIFGLPSAIILNEIYSLGALVGILGFFIGILIMLRD